MIEVSCGTGWVGAGICGGLFGNGDKNCLAVRLNFWRDAVNDAATILAFADEFFLVIFDEEKLLLQS